MLMRYSIQDFTTREIEKNQECYTITDIIIRKAVSFQNEKSDKIPKPNYQKWSPQGRPWPRGHILKSLASRPQVLENWPVLGSRTALFFELLKFCGAVEKFFGKRFFVEIA